MSNNMIGMFLLSMMVLGVIGIRPMDVERSSRLLLADVMRQGNDSCFSNEIAPNCLKETGISQGDISSCLQSSVANVTAGVNSTCCPIIGRFFDCSVRRGKNCTALDSFSTTLSYFSFFSPDCKELKQFAGQAILPPCGELTLEKCRSGPGGEEFTTCSAGAGVVFQNANNSGRSLVSLTQRVGQADQNCCKPILGVAQCLRDEYAKIRCDETGSVMQVFSAIQTHYNGVCQGLDQLGVDDCDLTILSDCADMSRNRSGTLFDQCVGYVEAGSWNGTAMSGKCCEVLTNTASCIRGEVDRRRCNDTPQIDTMVDMTRLLFNGTCPSMEAAYTTCGMTIQGKCDSEILNTTLFDMCSEAVGTMMQAGMGGAAQGDSGVAISMPPLRNNTMRMELPAECCGSFTSVATCYKREIEATGCNRTRELEFDYWSGARALNGTCESYSALASSFNSTGGIFYMNEGGRPWPVFVEDTAGMEHLKGCGKAVQDKCHEKDTATPGVNMTRVEMCQELASAQSMSPLINASECCGAFTRQVKCFREEMSPIASSCNESRNLFEVAKNASRVYTNTSCTSLETEVQAFAALLSVDTATPTPTPTPMLGGASSNAACFPGEAMVTREDGSFISMEKLRIGDRILTTSGSFSDVFFFSHRSPRVQVPFLAISTYEVTLTISSNHYLFVNDRLIPAGQAKIGDNVALADGTNSRILAIMPTIAKGLYNPHTLEGTAIVNGVQTSTYTTAVDVVVAKMLLAPVRAFYRMGVPLGQFLDEDAPLALLRLVPHGKTPSS